MSDAALIRYFLLQPSSFKGVKPWLTWAFLARFRSRRSLAHAIFGLRLSGCGSDVWKTHRTALEL